MVSFNSSRMCFRWSSGMENWVTSWRTTSPSCLHNSCRMAIDAFFTSGVLLSNAYAVIGTGKGCLRRLEIIHDPLDIHVAGSKLLENG